MQAQGRNRKRPRPVATIESDASKALQPEDPLDEPMTFRDLLEAIDSLLRKIPGNNSGHYLMRSLPEEIRSLANRRRNEGADARDPTATG
jgi:hypothetical protein